MFVFLPTCRLVELGDYAGFMAMDTAMTNNWHQPVQAIGSSKGDGIVFKHRALVVFNNNVDSAATGAVSINPSMDYEVFEAPPDDEQASYPDQFPLRMAMLIAQHSASMPDPYSITYTPTSKWNERLFGPPMRACDAGVNALLSVGLGGKGGKKRKWASGFAGGDTPTSYCSSPAVSGCSTVVANGGGGSTALALEAVPKWVMDGFINALHRVSMGSETFSACNFKQRPANTEARGMPELARIKEYEGTSLAMRRSPCIVSACFDGVVTVHKGNESYIWIAKTARVAHSAHREELVYMKCMDPECQSRVKEEKKKKGDLARAFDAYGWALLDRRNMGVITGSTQL